MFYMFEAMARSHQDVKDFRMESWYTFMEPDEPYKCTLGNLGQYAISLIGEFNQIYNYLKGRFDTTEWDDMGFVIYDPITDTDKFMSQYAVANPGGDYGNYNVQPPYPR